MPSLQFLILAAALLLLIIYVLLWWHAHTSIKVPRHFSRKLFDRAGIPVLQ